MKIYSLVGLLLLLLSSCVPSSQMGGMDGSGGDATSSSIQDVNKVVKEQWDSLPDTIQRYKTLLDEVKVATDLEGPGVDLFRSLVPFFSIDLASPIQNIKLKLQLDPCVESGHPRDGSYANGVICISSSRLTKIPKERLSSEVLGLLFHELGHAMGLGEDDCVRYQKAFIQSSVFGVGYSHPSYPGEDWKILNYFKTDTENLFLQILMASWNSNESMRGFKPLAVRLANDAITFKRKWGPGSLQPSWFMTPKAFTILGRIETEQLAGAYHRMPLEKLETYATLLAELNQEYSQAKKLAGTRIRSYEKLDNPKTAVSLAQLAYQALRKFPDSNPPDTTLQSISCQARVISAATNDEASATFESCPSTPSCLKVQLQLPREKSSYKFSIHLSKQWLSDIDNDITYEGFAPFAQVFLGAVEANSTPDWILDETQNAGRLFSSGIGGILQKGSVENLKIRARVLFGSTLDPNQFEISCKLAE